MFPARPLLFLLMSLTPLAAAPSSPWNPDQGDGTYRNPVLFADYSDPDVIRVGDDYYLTSSSFNCVPGLPILHSKDLVNWRIVNHALPRQIPEDVFDQPQHGNGVWAPCLRFHDHTFYLYYPDPDFGIYVVTATDPSKAWSKPVLVKSGRGLIDPTPYWDEDGQAYLLHAWAKSRAGFNNVLTLHKMSADGLRVTDEGRVVIDGNKLAGYGTLEGPKLYRRAGWYYIFAPAGGVSDGWQSVFRAKNIDGPYEDRIVMDQGQSPINGPHQGALVDTVKGEWWFLHFQDRGAYGRVVHLEPVAWKDGWPIIGSDPDGDGKGEPVLTHKKPNVGATFPIGEPQTSDDFSAKKSLGLQWQWQANPKSDWFSLTAEPGCLRLFARPAAATSSLYLQPNLLLQKFPAPEFIATAKISFHPSTVGERAGLIVFGDSYAWIGLEQTADGIRLRQIVCDHARPKGSEQETASRSLAAKVVYLRVSVRTEARCEFSASEDGEHFQTLGPEFTATVGRWMGSKVGLFSVGLAGADGRGFADIDWFHVTSIASH